jgi:hypothetical protein
MRLVTSGTRHGRICGAVHIRVPSGEIRVKLQVKRMIGERGISIFVNEVAGIRAGYISIEVATGISAQPEGRWMHFTITGNSQAFLKPIAALIAQGRVGACGHIGSLQAIRMRIRQSMAIRAQNTVLPMARDVETIGCIISHHLGGIHTVDMGRGIIIVAAETPLFLSRFQGISLCFVVDPADPVLLGAVCDPVRIGRITLASGVPVIAVLTDLPNPIKVRGRARAVALVACVGSKGLLSLKIE